MIFLNLAYSADSEFFAKIQTPPEQVSTNKDYLYIVGLSNAPEIAYFINGSRIGEVKVVDSTFHFHLHYGYGLSEITVAPVIDDSVMVDNLGKSIEILYSPTVSRKYSKYYKTYIFHGSEQAKICIDCHNLSGDINDTIKTANVCYQCHRHTQATFITHIPNDSLACINCHHLAEDLSYLSGGFYSAVNPCYGCHSNKVGEFDSEYIHGPVAGESCIICHNPHGSDFPPTLNDPQEVLCITCHQEIDKKFDLPVQHEPFRLSKCVSCHDPHATNNKWVLVKESEELCLNCHMKSNGLDFHQHPYNVKPKRKLEADLKLTERGNLECISCHDPHATKAQHLLRVDSEITCMGCHPDRYAE